LIDNKKSSPIQLLKNLQKIDEPRNSLEFLQTNVNETSTTTLIIA
jgi:hypothetical protein